MLIPACAQLPAQVGGVCGLCMASGSARQAASTFELPPHLDLHPLDDELLPAAVRCQQHLGKATCRGQKVHMRPHCFHAHAPGLPPAQGQPETQHKNRKQQTLTTVSTGRANAAEGTHRGQRSAIIHVLPAVNYTYGFHIIV